MQWTRVPLAPRLSRLALGTLLGGPPTRVPTPRRPPDAAAATPAEWLEQRGGIDNSGFVPGTLDATWRYKAPRPVRGIAVADGIVILGTESADADAMPGKFLSDQRGFVIALDVNNGDEQWRRDVASWIHGDPVIVNDTVVATFGRWPMVSPGGAAAFDLHTGAPIWSRRADSGLMPGPAVDAKSHALLAVGADGFLFDLSIRSGVARDSFAIRSADAMSSPRIDSAGNVFFGTMEALHDYSLRTHRENWVYRPSTLRAIGDIPVALTDSVVYTTGTHGYGFWRALHALPLTRFVALAHEAVRSKSLGSYRGWFQEQTLIAIDKSTGKMLWQRPLGIGLQVPRNTSGTPVLVRGDVVISSPVSRMVWAFDARTGRTKWSRQLSSIHKGALTVVGDELLLGDKAGRLTSLAAIDGRVTGSCAAGSGFTVTAPVVIGNTVLVALRDGSVYATPYRLLRARMRRSERASCFGEPAKAANAT
jgi:outer membrane protein assembly factor BamB